MVEEVEEEEKGLESRNRKSVPGLRLIAPGLGNSAVPSHTRCATKQGVQRAGSIGSREERKRA